jgi:hypothetical protein
VIGSPAASAARTEGNLLWVRLADGRALGVPLAFFPRLAHASEADRNTIEIGPGGLGLHWPALDEDISVAGLLHGRGDETREGQQHRQTCADCSSA